MMSEYVMEKHDYSRIKKLEGLHNVATFWDDVARLTKNVTSDHAVKRWQILAEVRYGELMQARKSFYED